MTPYRGNGMELHHGEALSTLRTMPDASVDSVVTDPPAGIGFMGKTWDSFGTARKADGQEQRDAYRAQDSDRPGYGFQGGSKVSLKDRSRFIAFLTEIMAECLRVAKPGSYALVWAIPRTSHWTGTAIEDAGWVIQDRISHLFGQGFPKHKSKLKPACEDWWLAWKPDRYATPLPGLDGCRVEHNGESLQGGGSTVGKFRGNHHEGYQRPWMDDEANRNAIRDRSAAAQAKAEALGRWPANVTLDEEAAAMLDEQSGQLTSGTFSGNRNEPKTKNAFSAFALQNERAHIGDTGGASRFFYVAKASKRDRDAGCDELQDDDGSVGDRRPSGSMSQRLHADEGRPDTIRKNTHPTVKPVDLMRWLCRLITPPGGIVLDAFMGSGTTGVAALEEKFRFIGIEREPAYYEIAKRRITAPAGPLFTD